MADDNDLERTEPASPRRRLGKAREEGPVAHSQEFTTFTVLIAASGSLWIIGSIIIQKLSAVLESGLRIEQAVAFNSALLLPKLFQLTFDGLLAIAPLLGWLMIVALLAPMLLSGWLFSSRVLFLDFKRLNPANGFKRIFSSRGLIEPLKTIVKTVIIEGVATQVIWDHKQDALDLIGMPLDSRADQHGPIST